LTGSRVKARVIQAWVKGLAVGTRVTSWAVAGVAGAAV